MSKQPDINTAWNVIFNELNVVKTVNRKGYFDVTSTTLNEYFESRLLCKIDFREKLPSVFKKNSYSILALSNGLYRIAPTDPFFKLDVEKLEGIFIEETIFPSWIKTIDPEDLTSESQALDAAVASGMMELFTGITPTLTVRGRKRCSPFILKLPVKNAAKSIVEYPISGVQIEIDGGYEDQKNLILVEAKNKVSKTMNLRQLIYPQLHFENVLSKNVSSIVLFYSKKDRVFNFIPVAFDAENVILDYKKVRRFRLKAQSAKDDDDKIIGRLLPSKKMLTDAAAPFPQANDLEKVLDAYDVLLERDSISKAEVFEDLPVSVVGRQYDYYINVLRWMKLVKVELGIVELTNRGRDIGALDQNLRLKAIHKIFLSDPLVEAMLTTNIEKIDKSLTSLYRISKTTPARRLSTIKRWNKAFQERIAI